MKYSVGYYTLSDGSRYVHIEAEQSKDVEQITRQQYDDVDKIFSVHREPTTEESTIWCHICEDHIKYSELRKVTYGSEWVHSICPGCGSELLEPYLPF